MSPAKSFLLLVATFTVAAGPLAAELRFKDVSETAFPPGALTGILGHGGAWGDYDRDGDFDLFVGGFADRPADQYPGVGEPVGNKLFLNLGDGTFARADQEVVEGFARTSGALFADLDNDGDLELYVANNRKTRAGKSTGLSLKAKLQGSSLFENQGGEFVDVSAECGACPDSLHTARNVGVLDFDRDGLLDLLVVEDRFTKEPRTTLFRNLGGLRFKDANAEAGIPDGLFGLGLAVADVNEDGFPDFFVPHSNRLFLGQPGGRFRECTELGDVFAWDPLHGEDWPCGAAFGDLNRDGRLDLVLSIHCETARNRIFLNEGIEDGIPRFRDVTNMAGFPAEVPARCPHVEIQDFDNDGWLDIYLSAGWLDEDGMVTPLVFRSEGAPREKGGIPQFLPPHLVEAPMVYYPAGPAADFDGDGRLDLMLINWFENDRCHLLRNESRGGNWLDVSVTGTSFNRMGIGSRIRVYRAGDPDALLGCQEVTIGYGYASGQPAVCHFGLGEAEEVDLEILFPNGKSVKKRGVPANRRLIIEEKVKP